MRHTMISVAVLAVFSLSAHGAAGLGEYNFDYDIAGDKSIRPVQVFDNGRSVYIQLSARAKAPPAVMEKVGEQVRPVPFRYEYPYLVLDNVRGEIVLALDGRSVFVSRRSSGAVTGVATPILVGRAVPPVVGGAARPAYPAAAPVAPAAGQPDYAGEMVYRQMRGSSLAPVHQPVRVAAAPSVADAAPVIRAPVPAQRGAVSSRDPGAAAQHYAAAGQVEKSIIHRVGYGDTLARVAARYGVPAHRIAADNGITNPNLIRVGQALTINKPDRTIMASAAPTRSAAPVVVERAAPPVRVAAAPVSAPSFASIAPSRGIISEVSPSDQVEKSIIHRVGYGDTLARVAAQYGVPAHRIAADNGIANPNLIRVGQALTINKPGRTVMADAAAPITPPQRVAAVPVVRTPVSVERAAAVPASRHAAGGHGERPIIHRVGRGETLARVAAQYDVPAHRIAEDNGITNPDLIRVGQALTINKPGRTVMADADAPTQRVAAAAVPVRVALAPRAAAALIASARGGSSGASLAGRVEILRIMGDSPEVNATLLAAARRAIARDGEIMLRGHSAALTSGERSAIANASAKAVRDQLIKNGIPADRLTLVSNPGRVMSPSRVDIVLIGSKESFDA